MFFLSNLTGVFLKFLLFGLYFGLFKILCKIIIRVSKQNIFVSNLIMFCFWLSFGLSFGLLSILYYNYTFCWFGLFGMILGLILIKISFEFFFDNLFLLLYNKFKLRSKERKDGNKRTA